MLPAEKEINGAKTFFEEIMGGKFANLGKEADSWVQITQSQTGRIQRDPNQDILLKKKMAEVKILKQEKNK